MASDESFSGDEFTPEQWERIRAHIRARGMIFEVFLPEAQANWLRAKISAGVFADGPARKRTAVCKYDGRTRFASAMVAFRPASIQRFRFIEKSRHVRAF